MTRQSQQKNDAYLRPAEVWQVLKIGRDTCYRMLMAGQIPGAIKIGKQWRIKSEIFWKALDKRAAAGEAENIVVKNSGGEHGTETKHGGGAGTAE